MGFPLHLFGQGQHGPLVLVPIPLTDRYLIAAKVNIHDPQPQALLVP